MSDAIEELLRQCVVRVPSLGTGFFVLPNVVLTCAHLFEICKQKQSNQTSVAIKWQGHEGTGKIQCVQTADRPDLPDLATLEIKWENDFVPEHPCVLLAEGVERGDEFYAFGHPVTDPPNSFEINGDSLAFNYDGPSFDGYGTEYIRARGSRALTGFSGSPVLNRRTRRVCGVLAMTLNLTAAEGGRMLPIRYAFEHFDRLQDRNKQHHQRTTYWSDILPGAQLWRHVAERCQRNVAVMQSRFKHSTDSYYVPRALESKFASFVDSKRSAMVIIGQSGMGKTTMVARLLSQYSANGHLCAMFESELLPTTIREVEPYIVNKLSSTDLTESQFWGQISAECVERSKCLIIFVDAVNEYNERRTGDARPTDVVAKLDGLVSRASDKYPNVKFVITSRPEIWHRAQQSVSESLSGYYAGDKELAHVLPRFSGMELEEAYEKYRTKWEVGTNFADLSELAKYHLRDPLLLSLATEVYAQADIPRELDTGEIFSKYYNQLEKDQNQSWLEQDHLLIQDLLSEMFVSDEEPEKSDVVKRTAIARDSKLRDRNPRLYDALDTDEANNRPGYRLKGRNVLRELKIKSSGSTGETEVVVQIRFTYDRFAEYLLARNFHGRILEKTRQGESLAGAASSLIVANLSGTQQMTIVYGALQQTLLRLQRERGDYAQLLQQVAERDARGLGLVVSVLARTARLSPQGIETVRALLKNLEGRAGRGESAARFPLIDAVYRMLRNDEYRIWLAEPEHEQVKSAHLDVLYGYFRWGFEHSDATVAASAIQYLSFLWQGKHSLDDAVNITNGILAQVRPLSIAAFIFQTARARIPQNLAGLMILALGEAREKNRSDQVVAAARGLILRLQLQKSTLFRLISPFTSTLTRYTTRVLKALGNPVSFEALEAFYARNRESNLRDFEEVMFFFRPECNVKRVRTHVRELSRNENSFVMEMLSLALAVWHEKQCEAGQGEEYLRMLLDVFSEPGAPATTQYCCSLALYHINYFGKHPSDRSIEIMGQMADVILRERRGVFTVQQEESIWRRLRRRFERLLRPGGQEDCPAGLNFNIIGTYGRSLYRYRNERSAADSAITRTTQRPFQYAIDAIERAKAKEVQDSAYYLYVCENVGLLGVLIEPTQIFEVITHILKDVEAISRDGHKALAFPFDEGLKAQARARVMQSLANIRVLYRQEVDKYLLDELESTDLYGEVTTKLSAEFNIATFYSWAFEQLMFRALTTYYHEVGSDIVTSFMNGAQSGSARECVALVVGRVVERLREIAE